jgi:hypothetical protein
MNRYLRVDWVLVGAEKILCKETLIICKEKYQEWSSEAGIVKSLGDEWMLFDIKDLSKRNKILWDQ